ncbi:phosphopantetheine-binding protein [Porticoccaceae bacterium]|jgi:acyl carrier protein|nr:phosphopantetheine-binding protein [Porticoccaceae bacterium]|tara:strand:+ start:549 stop:773 length:225 start_codon:yes stop_codon:yes gene_type:complete
MKLEDFLELVADALDCEDAIVLSDNVLDIEGWDSLGVLSIVSMLDGLGMPVELEKFEDIVTVQDFVTLVGFVDE